MHPRRLAVALAALLALPVLGACQPAASQDPATSPSPTPVEVSETATPQPQHDTTWDIQAKPTITKSARDRLGEYQSRQGVDFAVDFVKKYAFNSDFYLAKRPQHRAALEGVGKWMKGEAAEGWQGYMRDYFTKSGTKKSQKAIENISALTFYDPHGRGGKKQAKSQGKPIGPNLDGGPGIVNPTITRIRTYGYPDHFGQRVEITATADLRLLHGGVPKTLGVTRELTLWVYTYDDHKRKIYGWKGYYKFGSHYVPEK